MKKIFVLSLVLLLVTTLVCAVGCDKSSDENDVFAIYVSKEPDKVNYYAGESLDVTGCEITVRTRNHGDYVVKVTPEMVSGFSSALGTHTLTITYIVGDQAFKTTQVIQVISRVAVSAVITTPPVKTTFVEGEKIDLSGLIAEVTFSDETVADRHFPAFTLNKSIAEMGMEEVELKLDKVTLKVAIQVVPKVISYLKATSLPLKTVYNEGEYFDPTGLEVYAFYNDNSRGYMVEFEIVDENVPLVASQKSVIVRDRYSRDMTLEIPITVNQLEILGIELLNKDEIRTSYLKGSFPDFSDIKAKVTFEDGLEKIVNADELVFDLPLDKPLAVGDHTVKVRFKFASASEQFDSFVIHVVEEKLPVALLVQTNAKFHSLYEHGETISLEGLSVYVVYNDGSEDWVILENWINSEVEGFSMTEVADFHNPFIEFRIGDVFAKIEIYVSPDESIFDVEKDPEDAD